jgi:hypothetical protein
MIRLILPIYVQALLGITIKQIRDIFIVMYPKFKGYEVYIDFQIKCIVSGNESNAVEQ